MSSDLDLYKQNRIATINRIFIDSMNRLYSTLVSNLRSISSRFGNKQAIINSLNAQYKANVASLKNQFVAEVNKVNSFQPVFKVAKTNKKIALLVGINYIGTQYELAGCIADSNNMKDVLTNHGFTQFTMLNDTTDTKPTKSAILAAFKTLITSAISGDVVLFHFSGHGSYTADLNGDETDGNDEMIISSDLQGILDDDFKAILSAYMKEGVTVIGLFDSCHSGTMFDLKYNYLNSDNYDKYTENGSATECSGNVLMISGCRDSQTSDDAVIAGKDQGAMTWAFTQALETGAGGSWRQLLKDMRDALKTNGFTQIPQLSTDSFYDIDSKVFL